MKHADGVNAKRNQDQRVQRTRAAIIDAFNTIVLRERLASSFFSRAVPNMS